MSIESSLAAIADALNNVARAMDRRARAGNPQPVEEQEVPPWEDVPEGSPEPEITVHRLKTAPEPSTEHLEPEPVGAVLPEGTGIIQTDGKTVWREI